MRKQRTFTAEFKREVAEELLSGTTRPAQICRRYSISSGLFPMIEETGAARYTVSRLLPIIEENRAARYTLGDGACDTGDNRGECVKNFGECLNVFLHIILLKENISYCLRYYKIDVPLVNLKLITSFNFLITQLPSNSSGLVS